jgi:uncharacterized protein (DUF433 family)
LPLDVDVFGQGIYSPRQAARLIGGTPQEVLRWTRGSGPTSPLWKAHYQEIDDATELNFSDLIELRVVKAFRRANISLQAIRFAISYAEKMFAVEHPLSSLGFKTDGEEILMEAIEQDESLVSLSKKRPGQRVFKEIVKQSLFDLEYEDGQAVRWHPASAKAVVIDPARSFGTPILHDYGISTLMIADEFKAFADAKYLSKIYDVPLRLVNEAIRYEATLDKAAMGTDGQSSV